MQMTTMARPPHSPHGTHGAHAAHSLWSAWDGLLVLDACGCVTFCSNSAAELLGRGVARIVGQQVTSLIPELPFERHMPEFNLAYVSIYGGTGAWTRRALQTTDGRRVVVEVSVGNIEDIGRRSIVLILKQPGAAQPGAAQPGAASGAGAEGIPS